MKIRDECVDNFSNRWWLARITMFYQYPVPGINMYVIHGLNHLKAYHWTWVEHRRVVDKWNDFLSQNMKLRKY